MITSRRSSIGTSLLGAAIFLAASILAACGGSGVAHVTMQMPPLPTPSAFPSPHGSLLPAGLGGSNYGWYYLGPGCDRETYGVIYNYDTQKSTIDAQLGQMYINGQRRLRIPIFFGRDVNTGSVMSSSGGNLAPRFRANLANLLGAVKAAGFVEIEVSFHPQAGNNPNVWENFSDDYFQEDWNLIQNLHPIIAGAGIPYHIDLTNEAIPPGDGIPPGNAAALLEYDQKLWNLYAAKYGKSDTLGFSLIGDTSSVYNVSAVYGPSTFGEHGAPPEFDVHNYDETGNNFATAVAALTTEGYAGTPWIIGEAFYNDSIEAASLRARVNSTGQKVLWLTQWPDTLATASCAVSIAPPLDFSNYQIEGF